VKAVLGGAFRLGLAAGLEMADILGLSIAELAVAVEREEAAE
jgi:hypothetical protein